jgi:methylaspartate ammonia-lyase
MSGSLKICEVKTISGQGAYYYEDVTALQKRSIEESQRWSTLAETQGFKFVREIAEVVSIGIKTKDGVWSWGDCVGVSYSGKSGREGVFRSSSGCEEIKKYFTPLLLNKRLSTFREVMNEVNLLPLHRAVVYGVSQALLGAVASQHKEPMWRTLQREWGITDGVKEVPLQGSSGSNRKVNADKMIINRLAGLPHGQIDDIPTQLGPQGELLLEYVTWLKSRIPEFGGSDYSPVIHLDVHGAIGHIFNQDPQKIATYLLTLEKQMAPYRLRIESVSLGKSRAETIQELMAIGEQLRLNQSRVELVADEWANTKEDMMEFVRNRACQMIHLKMPDMGGVDQTTNAVLELKRHNMGTLLGGSCIETDISARVSVHVALATQPSALLAKPGMGIDEAIQIMRNEMNRALAL